MKLKLYDLKTLAATQLLFLIEYASFDAGSCIGSGILQSNSEKCLSAEKTGGTSTLGNSSGVGANGAVSYRGEENLWGNTPTYIQLPTENGSAETGIENSITDPPTELLLWQPPINGYIDRLAASKLFIPAVTAIEAGIIPGCVDTTSTDKGSWSVGGMMLSSRPIAQYFTHGLVHSGEAGGLFSYCKSDGGEAMFDSLQNLQPGKPVRFMSARFVMSPARNTVDKTKVEAENVLLSGTAKSTVYVDGVTGDLPIKTLGDNVDTAIQTLSHDLYGTMTLVNAMQEKNAFISSWADVKAIVDARKAAVFFNVGDKLICNHSTYGLLVWEIVEISTGIVYASSITLMLHEPFLGPNIVFSSTGDPRWENSDIRKWLNSDMQNGSWYAPASSGIAPEIIPESYRTINGFLSGLDSDFLDIVGTSAVPVCVHSLDGNDTLTTETIHTYDRFYLPSVTEVFGGLNNDFDEGNILHKFYIENAEPGRDANSTRVFRGRNWRLRSADDTENVLYVTGSRANGMYIPSSYGKIVAVSPSIYRIGGGMTGTDICYLMPMCRIISGDEDVESGSGY